MVGAEEPANRGRVADTLENHWTKPTGPAGYYWFLTFESSAALHSLTEECQGSIDISCFDLVPREGLHLTLERIARPGEASADHLAAVEARARKALCGLSPFELRIGVLRRVPSAIIFDVSPVARVSELQSRLRAATMNGSIDPSDKSPRPVPHITLAYCNSDGPVPAGLDVDLARTAGVERVVHSKVVEVVMVFLERGRSSYSWERLARIPLAGLD